MRGVGRILNRSYRRADWFPAPTETGTLDGDRFQVDFAHDLEWRLFAWGQYERHVQDVLISHVRPGDICVDVGANIGVHTLPLARAVGPAGLVIAVEANPHVAERLQSNLDLNALSNVRVVNGAAYATSGLALHLNMTPKPSRSQAQASVLPLDHLTDSDIIVQTVTVDSLRSRSTRLIKIDVEGAEWDVLQGARRTLEKDHPALVFEFNRLYSRRSFEDFRIFLTEFGYTSLLEIRSPAGRIRRSRQPPVDLLRRDPTDENVNVLAV